MEGYVGDPEATLRTRRGLWHHTGDRGRLDQHGYLYFESRLSDSIRRRGENVSAQELEELVQAHPDLVEAAAIGVPSELTRGRHQGGGDRAGPGPASRRRHSPPGWPNGCHGT